MLIENQNTMGWFGLTWPEKVHDNARKFLTKDQFKKLTVTTVKNVHRRYINLLTKGYKPISFIDHSNIITDRFSMDTIRIINILKNELNLNIVYVNAVLRSLYDLAVTGKIQYDKLDPVSIKQDIAAGKVFKEDFFKKMVKPALVPAIIAGSGILTAIYFLNQKRTY